MVGRLSKIEEVHLLASDTDWALSRAVHDIFEPRGVRLMTARSTAEFIDVIESKPVHAMIVDMDSSLSGLATVRTIRRFNPVLPCIMLSNQSSDRALGKALSLDVFSVIDKPVDMRILQEQLHRLFVKNYNSRIFGI
ncbi:MAG: response regulator [Planctomycetes bacterium]|nr:response regulator [Planctomycetota bacterium]